MYKFNKFKMNRRLIVTVVIKSAPVPVRVVVVVGQSQGDVRVVHLYQRSFGLSTSREEWNVSWKI